MVDPKETQYYYKLGDVFTSASTSETQGLTYIEALSCGLPLVCQNDDCLIDVIYNGQNGYKCENVEEIINRINEICEDEEKRKMFAQNSLDNSIKFSQETFGKTAIELYNKILSKPRKEKVHFYENETNIFFKIKDVFKNI